MENNSPKVTCGQMLFDNQQHLSPNEVADRLSISRDYFYVLSKRRNIPRLQIGKRSVRYKWSDVLAALSKEGDSKNGT